MKQKVNIRKWLRRMLIFMAAVVIIGLAGGALFLSQTKFGRHPEGGRLERVTRSPNYVDGEFRNLVERPVVAASESRIKSYAKFFLERRERPAPENPLPSVKVDLKALDKSRDTVIWLGHSSFYIQLAGRTILVDPVLSDQAAPVFFANKAFTGSNPYTADDFPDIDFLLITHDHWDHLDYPTVMALKPKIKAVFCPLGVGAHFERWKFPPEMVAEGDWGASMERDSLTFHILPAQHYSGRWLTRNKSLWASLAIVTPERRLFLSGDSGYGPHFQRIGQDFGGFDLAILDAGQYNEQWAFIHMNPEEAARAAEDLGAKALLPAHVGKFNLAYHSWDEPFVRITAASANKDYRLLTPLIGQPVDLGDPSQPFTRWWETHR